MNDRTGGETAHWTELVTVRTGRIGPPLQPGREDIAALEPAIARWAGAGKTGLLLGMTRDIAQMSWPAGSRLLAFDHTIGAVTTFLARGPLPIPTAAIAADWRQMPLPNGAIDFALGDGSYNSVDSTDSQHRVSRELVRVLKPGGGVAVRFYVRPDVPESPAQVFDDLHAGRIGWFTVFKVRLLMATPAAADGSTRLADTWDLWSAARVDKAALAATTGWPRETIETIESYRGKAVRYVFHTLADTRRLLAPYFVESAIVTKSYELGALCPTLLLQARS